MLGTTMLVQQSMVHRKLDPRESKGDEVTKNDFSHHEIIGLRTRIIEHITPSSVDLKRRIKQIVDPKNPERISNNLIGELMRDSDYKKIKGGIDRYNTWVDQMKGVKPVVVGTKK